MKWKLPPPRTPCFGWPLPFHWRAFGAISQKTHFCTMGAVADIINMEDWSRMRMWLLAIAVAILGSCSAACERPHRSEQVDLSHGDTAPGCRYLVGGLSVRHAAWSSRPAVALKH
jgi:hypothetical protein